MSSKTNSNIRTIAINIATIGATLALVVLLFVFIREAQHQGHTVFMRGTVAPFVIDTGGI